MNTLMLMSVVGYLPHSVYQAYVCSSGAHGYGAFKEALEVGRPRHTLLVTNVDIRTIEPPTSSDETSQTDGTIDDDNVRCYDGVSIIIHNDPIANITTPSWDGEEDWAMCIPSACTTLTTVGNIQTTTDRFLSDLYDVQSIDLSGLSNATLIGSHFLAMCPRLKSIDLTPLSNVTRIDMRFFYNCTGLECIDLSPLRHVTSINTYFLFGCASLTTIDATPLCNLAVITSLFLSKCFALKTINLSACSSLRCIEMMFLGDCRNLRSINLPSGTTMFNLTRIEDSFLKGCSRLESIEMMITMFVRVTYIGNNFLMGCRRLTSVNFSSLNYVTTIGSSFMAKCEGLTSIDVRPLVKVRTIGSAFLSGCSGLETIDLEGVNPVVRQAITLGAPEEEE